MISSASFWLRWRPMILLPKLARDPIRRSSNIKIGGPRLKLRKLPSRESRERSKPSRLTTTTATTSRRNPRPSDPLHLSVLPPLPNAFQTTYDFPSAPPPLNQVHLLPALRSPRQLGLSLTPKTADKFQPTKFPSDLVAFLGLPTRRNRSPTSLLPTLNRRTTMILEGRNSQAWLSWRKLKGRLRSRRRSSNVERSN